MHASFTVDGSEGIARDVVKRGSNIAIFARSEVDAYVIALVSVGSDLRFVSDAHGRRTRRQPRSHRCRREHHDRRDRVSVAPPPAFALDFYKRDETKRAELLDELHCSIDRTGFSVEPR